MRNSQSRGNGITLRAAGKHGNTGHDLTVRQKLFALEYLKDLNATQAAIRAGYAARSAKVTGCRLLTNANLQAEIQGATNRLSKKLELKAEDTLRGIANIAKFDPRKLFDEKGNAKDIHDLDLETAQVLSGFDFVTLYEGEGEQKHAFGQLRKVRFSDRLKAYELLGRHQKLFTDKVEHGLDDETKRLLADKLDLTNATDAQLQELSALGAGGDKGQGDGRDVPAQSALLVDEPHKDKG
jgi:phage terminase small subunit